KLIRDLDRTDRCDATDVVAAKIKQHEMFGALFRISKEFFLERLVFVRCRAAVPCSRDRTNGDNVLGDFHQDFRTRSRDSEVAKIEKGQIGRRIGSPEGSIEREGRQLERGL